MPTVQASASPRERRPGLSWRQLRHLPETDQRVAQAALLKIDLAMEVTAELAVLQGRPVSNERAGAPVTDEIVILGKPPDTNCRPICGWPYLSEMPSQYRCRTCRRSGEGSRSKGRSRGSGTTDSAFSTERCAAACCCASRTCAGATEAPPDTDFAPARDIATGRPRETSSPA